MCRCWTAITPRQAHARYLRGTQRSEEHTSELQSHSDLHSFPTRRSSDLMIEPMSREQIISSNVQVLDSYHSTSGTCEVPPWNTGMTRTGSHPCRIAPQPSAPCR